MDYKDQNRDSELVSWNINGAFATLVSDRLVISQRFLDQNNFVKYFQVLNSIFDLLTNNVEESIITKMDGLKFYILKRQKYFLKHSRKDNDGIEEIITDEDRKGRFEYVEGIRLYQRRLLLIIKQCGLITSVSQRSKIKL